MLYRTIQKKIIYAEKKATQLAVVTKIGIENVKGKCLKRIKKIGAEESGQGTTEYAILVGVLVVIAIIAIAIFKPKIEELWNAIADGINGL